MIDFPPRPEPFAYEGRLVRVVDGDTIEADVDLGHNIWKHGQSIRLLYVSAPDVRKDDPESRRATREATLTLEMIAPRGTLLLIASKELDSFGRMLAIVWAGNATESLNQQMLASGTTTVWQRKP